jgi:integrase
MKIVNGEKRGRPGRWLVDFYDQDGKRRIETYETQKAAKVALSRRLEELRKGTYRAPAEMPTLAELAAGWLASKADRRPSTRYCWENHVHVHIVPALGEVRVDQVTPRLVEERLRNVLRERLAPQTVNKVLGTLTAIYDYGARHGTIDRNPAKLAERLRVGTAEVLPGEDGEANAPGREIDPDEVPSPEEVKRLLVASAPGVFRTFFLTAALTGARSGELLALTWEDVDFDGAEIHIRRGVTWARTREDREKGIRGARYFAPKNKTSRRSVEMPTELAAALRRWKLACPPSRDGLVFPKADGMAMHRKILAEQGLWPALARAELRRFGVHALRHFFASELIRRGYPPTEVAARLGHSSPMVTMTVYARWYRGATSDAVAGLAKTLCEA